jgi:hypothetical protein
VNKHIEILYTGQTVPEGDPSSAFFALNFPPEAQIEKIVVTETSGLLQTGGANGEFTVDVFNSETAEGKAAKVQSLYKVVATQTGSNSAMELFIQNGGMFRNTDGTDAAPISKIYVELSVTGNAGVACLFDVAIGAVIPN